MDGKIVDCQQYPAQPLPYRPRRSAPRLACRLGVVDCVDDDRAPISKG